jgi:thiamine biosynthesis lipoprotein
LHRRDFFDPRRLGQAAGPLLGALDLNADAPEAGPDEVSLLRLGWRAMATTFELLLPADAPAGVAAGREAFDLLDALEEQLSAYRETSEVCRLNRRAHRHAVRVEPRLFALLQEAARVHAETGGAFDITAGALSKAWGFFRGPRRVPGASEHAAALARVGMQYVELDPQRLTVRLGRPGLELNLGSIGKGYALDRLGELLAARWNLSTLLLHGGSSSVYARGNPHGDGQGWRVRIRHPWDAGRVLAEVRLRDRALGTSAATFQHLEYQGKKLGHVLDPRTGWPAEGLASVSVVAPTAAEADALSTAFFVAGAETARRYCEAHPNVGAVLLAEDSTEPVVVGLPASDYVLR